MHYFVHPITKNDASTLRTWRYPEPYALYNLAGANEQEDLRYFLDPRNQFHSVVDEDGVLVGFCSFGEDAQVPGGDYTLDALDIGLGLRPDLTGQGFGASFLSAILHFAQEQFGVSRFRATVAVFNGRSRRMFERLGFRAVQTFVSRGEQAQTFTVLVGEFPQSRRQER
ncbi:MAG: N-acetyltransferase [Chloroflexi bacterium]|nr:MAG: N-acetyltransferase [Chloroflexota bacterium]